MGREEDDVALAGGCRCGQCRYTLAYDAVPVTYACHCLDCQTMTGSACTLHALLPAERLSIEGDIIAWENRNSQGKLTSQRFCATCKTRLYSTNEGRPGTVLLRMGTLDDSMRIVPAVHIWVRRKQFWVGLPADAETYEEGMPPERAKAVIGPNFA